MAYLALYRLYRPKNFQEVVGQDHITRTLKNQVATGRIGHAYLFSGARGTGKTSTAKVLAKAVNCLNPSEGEPCGECELCRMSAEDLSVDILEIDAASNNGVDEIRDLREKISFAPSLCRYKVYIIDEVHMLSTGAFNALLKTLEEPPAHAVFILATTEMHKLPATILSRCQRFDFKRIPEATILRQLRDVAAKQGADCEEQALEAVAHAAAGGMRDALSILDQCLGYAGNKLAYADVVKILGGAGADTAHKLADAVLAGDVVSCMDIVQGVYDGGADMAVFSRELIEYFRRLMIESAKGGKAGLPLRAVQELSRAESSMRYSPQPRVTLEAALVRLCVAGEGADVDSLLERIERLEATVDSLRRGAVSAPVAQRNDVAAAAAPDAQHIQAQPAAQTKPVTIAEQEDKSAALPSAALEEPQQADEDLPPWQDAPPPDDMHAAAEEPPTEAQPATIEQQPAEQPKAAAAADAPPADAEQPEPTPETPSSEVDLEKLFSDMLAIVRKKNPGARPMLKLAKPEALQDGTLMLRLKQEDAVIAQALNQPSILKALNEAATEAAGFKVVVQCVVGKDAPAAKAPAKQDKAKPAAPAPAPAQKSEAAPAATAAPALEQQDKTEQMLERVKDVFGMDVEIVD